MVCRMGIYRIAPILLHSVEVGAHLDVLLRLETIELVKQLKHSSLHLTITTGAAFQTGRANRVNLIHEDNRWRVLPVTEQSGVLVP